MGALLLVTGEEAKTPSLMAISGEACGRKLSGTGFLADDVVITNAHVVAGATEVAATDALGIPWRADVVAFDPAADLAALRLDGGARAWRAASFGDADAGDRGSVVATDFEIRRRIRAHIDDIYGAEAVVRPSLEVEAVIAPGDSGAPLVDEMGAVVGVVYASSRGKNRTAYAIRAPEVEEFLATVGDTPVESGPCR